MKDIEDALQRLDNLTQEMARMGMAEILRLTHTHYDNQIKDANDKVEAMERKLQSLKDVEVGLPPKWPQEELPPYVAPSSSSGGASAQSTDK